MEKMLVVCLFLSAIHYIPYSFAADEECPTERCPLLFVPEFQCADNTTHNMTFGDNCERLWFNCYSNKGKKNFTTNYEYGSCVQEDGCTRSCNFKTFIVCASNGCENKTFNNPCYLSNENCKIKNPSQKYKLVKHGSCETDCPKFCTKEYKPVCAKDRKGREKTFGNKCELNRSNCPNKSYTFLYDGKCKKNPDGNTHCPKMCPEIYLPVCAKDRKGREKTFGNRCELNRSNCPNETYTLLYDGACENNNSCGNKTCEKPCPKIRDPICAKDKKGKKITFPNKCVFDVKNCKANGSYAFVSNGSCESSCPDICTYYVYKPICTGDKTYNRTFPSECEWKKTNCHQNKTYFIKLYDGECKFDCSQNCSSHPKEYHPICAKNSQGQKTFDLSCDLTQQNCQNGNDTYVYLYPGRCNGADYCSPPPVQATPADGPPKSD